MTKQPKTENRKPKTEHGFTLIELAIVLVIIGLVVSGILVASTLLDSAKSITLMADTKKYRQQIDEFYDRYQSIPGDMYNAKYTGDFKIGVWEDAIANGNGNGRIEQDDINGETNEELLAWQHLQLSGILNANLTGELGSGYYPDENIIPAGIDGAGYTLTSILKGEEKPTRRVYLRLGSDEDSDIYDGAALTLAKAIEFDDKFDDGIASSGTILMLGEDCLDEDSDDGSDYVASSIDPDLPSCTGYFLMR